MPIEIELQLSPEAAHSQEQIREQAARVARVPLENISEVKIIRKSLDARKAQIIFVIKAEVYLQGETPQEERRTFRYQPLKRERTCHIIGFGPAGIFAALQCLEQGIK